MSQRPITTADKVRAIFAISAFFVMLMLMIPVSIVLIIISFGRLASFIVDTLAAGMARICLRILQIDFRVIRHVNPIPSPAVYISNHSSTLDILTLLSLGLPGVRFVAKWEFQYNPFILVMGRLTGQVFIRREDREKAISTIQKSYDRVKRRRLSLYVAPEGTRKHEGVIGPFKKGAFRMAMDLGYPIVPIYFEGTRELSSGASLFARPGTIEAHIHPAIDTSGWTLETLPEQIDEIRKQYLVWAGVNQMDED